MWAVLSVYHGGPTSISLTYESMFRALYYIINAAPITPSPPLHPLPPRPPPPPPPMPPFLDHPWCRCWCAVRTRSSSEGERSPSPSPCHRRRCCRGSRSPNRSGVWIYGFKSMERERLKLPNPSCCVATPTVPYSLLSCPDKHPHPPYRCFLLYSMPLLLPPGENQAGSLAPP